MNRIHPAFLILVLLLVAIPAVGQELQRVGNLNQPAQTVPDILFGDQTLAYIIRPYEQISCPEGGFMLQQVGTYLDFSENQIPGALRVRGGLLRAIPEGAGFVPGEPYFYGEIVDIPIPEPGQYLIEAPVSMWAVPVDEVYFLALHFEGPAEASLVIDDEPAPGIEFINPGNGWIDMFEFDKTSGGKVIIWGDIVCGVVVEADASSWSQVKQLFR